MLCSIFFLLISYFLTIYSLCSVCFSYSFIFAVPSPSHTLAFYGLNFFYPTFCFSFLLYLFPDFLLLRFNYFRFFSSFLFLVFKFSFILLSSCRMLHPSVFFAFHSSVISFLCSFLRSYVSSFILAACASLQHAYYDRPVCPSVQAMQTFE